MDIRVPHAVFTIAAGGSVPWLVVYSAVLGPCYWCRSGHPDGGGPPARVIAVLHDLNESCRYADHLGA